jgi:hypothetical protein
MSYVKGGPHLSYDLGDCLNKGVSPITAFNLQPKYLISIRSLVLSRDEYKNLLPELRKRPSILIWEAKVR